MIAVGFIPSHATQLLSCMLSCKAALLPGWACGLLSVHDLGSTQRQAKFPVLHHAPRRACECSLPAPLGSGFWYRAFVFRVQTLLDP